MTVSDQCCCGAARKTRWKTGSCQCQPWQAQGLRRTGADRTSRCPQKAGVRLAGAHSPGEILAVHAGRSHSVGLQVVIVKTAWKRLF